MVVNAALKRRRRKLFYYRIKKDSEWLFLENTLAQLVIAKNTNIELIKKYEEKKLEEHRYLFIYK